MLSEYVYMHVTYSVSKERSHRAVQLNLENYLNQHKQLHEKFACVRQQFKKNARVLCLVSAILLGAKHQTDEQ